MNICVLADNRQQFIDWANERKLKIFQASNKAIDENHKLTYYFCEDEHAIIGMEFGELIQLNSLYRFALTRIRNRK